MSECVVRMEMPSNCERCPMCGTASGGNGRYELWCMCGDIPASRWRRPTDCPIICSLPEGHGRLVDADAFISTIRPLCEEDKFAACTLETAKRMTVEHINNARTIVPAERSETEQV